MDAFERARQKHAKNLERKQRYEAPKIPEIVPELLQIQEPPKEKPKHAAFIEVIVRLPDRSLSVCLTKPHVYQNVAANRLTKSEIKKCIEDGFRPLLGGLDDIPGGGK